MDDTNGAMAQLDLGIPGLSEFAEVGRGGSSVVFRAWQADLGRHVAVKVIHATAEASVRRRFERERQAMGRLSEHPGIAQVHTTGRTRTGEYYLVMPYYSAGTLADRIHHGQALGWEEASEIVETVARTLGDAHGVGIVHRDVKPANIVFTAAGEPRVTDFGISVLNAGHGADSTTPSFTPYYSAPEAFTSGEVEPTLDTYSLGATLYALVTGHPPFRRPDGPNDALSVMSRAATDPVDGIGESIPAPINEFIIRAMDKDPARRPADGHDFAAFLQAAVFEARTGEPAPTVVPGYAPLAHGSAGPSGPSPERLVDPSGSASRPPRRLWIAALGALVAAAGLLALVSFVGDGDQGAAPPESTVPGAPQVIGLAAVDVTDHTARIVYRGTVCSGTEFVIEGLMDGASGFPVEDRCWDSHQLLLGRPFFTPGPLEPDTEYTVSVLVIDEEGRRSATAEVTFRTDDTYPVDRAPRILGLNVSGITGREATISFSTDLCAGSVFYLDGELLHGDGYPDTGWCWNQHPYTYRDLQPNTSYLAKIEARSKDGVVTTLERAFSTAVE